MFTDAQIERMRYELEHPEVMKKRIEKEKWANEFINKTKERFKAEGRDFDKEFTEWKKKQQDIFTD